MYPVYNRLANKMIRVPFSRNLIQRTHQTRFFSRFASLRSPVNESQSETARDLSPEELARFRRIEVTKGVFQSLGFLILVFGGFTIYKDYPYYKQKVKSYWQGESTVQVPEKATKKVIEYLNMGELTKSTERPGVYLWGSNEDGVVDPYSKVRMIKMPKRIAFFDGKVLRDLKTNSKMEERVDDLNIYLDDSKGQAAEVDSSFSSAFAIDDHGDLVQWGKGFNEKDPTPKYTLKGLDLAKGEFSDRVLYLQTRKGEVLYIPIDEKTQKEMKKEKNGLFSTKAEPFIGKLDTSKVGKVADFKTGTNHLIVLGANKKAYVASTGIEGVYENPKNHGQFGLLEYSHFEPAPKPNILHEIYLLNHEILTKKDPLAVPGKDRSVKEITKIMPREIVQIATGNYHTLARDSLGNVYLFGKNTFGQLGFQVTYATEKIPVPRQIEFFSQYFSKLNLFPQATDIRADSHSSFVTLNARNVSELLQSKTGTTEFSETFYFAFGKGLYGQLGLDYYTHANATPKKMSPLLHTLQEYDEGKRQMRQIGIADWTIGKNHVFVTLDNRDVLAFGNNKYGQLGNGKVKNQPSPASVLSIVEKEDCMKNPLKSGLPQVEADSNVVNLTRYQNKLNNRMQLLGPVWMKYQDGDGKKRSSNVEQVIVAGHEVSGVYYRAA